MVILNAIDKRVIDNKKLSVKLQVMKALNQINRNWPNSFSKANQAWKSWGRILGGADQILDTDPVSGLPVLPILSQGPSTGFGNA